MQLPQPTCSPQSQEYINTLVPLLLRGVPQVEALNLVDSISDLRNAGS